MGYYLLERPPARQQYRRPRRQRQTGAVGTHTTEGLLDAIAPDTGAENVAGYIVIRTTPGSYHRTIDSDSVVVLLPDDAEAFSIAADRLNQSTVNFALACRTTDLDPDHPWTLAAFRLFASEAVAYWRREGHDPVACARWLTRPQVLAGEAGLFHHGTVQPWDRHDAFTRHPRRAELEALMVRLVLEAAGLDLPEDPVTDDDVNRIAQAVAQIVKAERHVDDAATEKRRDERLDAIERRLDDLDGLPDAVIESRRHTRKMVLAGVQLAAEAIGRITVDDLDPAMIRQAVADAVDGLDEQVADELADRLAGR